MRAASSAAAAPLGGARVAAAAASWRARSPLTSGTGAARAARLSRAADAPRGGGVHLCGLRRRVRRHSASGGGGGGGGGATTRRGGGAAELQRALNEAVDVLDRRVLEQPLEGVGVLVREERASDVPAGRGVVGGLCAELRRSAPNCT